MRYFVTCAAHLEPYLEKEIHQLGYTKTSLGFRGIFVDADINAMYVLNYYLRFATRVLMPLKSIKVYQAQDLYQESLNFPWENYISPSQTFSIDAAIHHKEFKSSLYGIQLIKDAICDRLRKKTGQRPNVETKDPDIQIHCYLDDKIGVLSIDTSNPPLFKRGWRTDSVEAPLQETLAAVMCKIANVEKAHMICDPCCGSGTIAIEAALQKLSIPSGFYRPHFGFQNFKDYNPELFEEAKTLHGMHKTPFQCIAFDKDPEAIKSAEANIKHASLESYIKLKRIDLASNFIDEKIDLIITNPPFGKRLKVQSNFFHDLHRFLTRLKSKPEIFILLEQEQLKSPLPFNIIENHPLASGGLKLNFIKVEPKL
jgi:putative N6-adenine-specific DNA methylase